MSTSAFPRLLPNLYVACLLRLTSLFRKHHMPRHTRMTSTAMMIRMKYQGIVHFALVESATLFAATVTRSWRQTPKPGTMAQSSFVATQLPEESVVVLLQLRHAELPAPEHVEQDASQVVQAPHAPLDVS